MLGEQQLEELLYPVGRSRSSCPREFEELALVILRRLSGYKLLKVERAQDVIQISVDDEDGFSVVVTPKGVELRLAHIEWTGGAYGPELRSRLWKRLETSEIEGWDEAAWHRVFKAAFQARQRQKRRCRFCERKFVPELMHAQDVCQGCAERHLEVVH